MRTRVLGSFLAALCVALAAGASPAAAAIYDGSVDGESSSSTAPGRALTKLSLSYDSTAGTLVGTGTFAGDPSAGVQAALLVHLGTLDGTVCKSPQALVLGQLAPGGIVNSSISGAPSGTNYGGSIAFSGTTATLTATADAFKDLPYDCLFGDVKTLDSAATTLSTTDGWARMTVRPGTEPPAPQPQPQPQPSTPAPTPQPTTPAQPAAPVTPPAPAAKLTLGVTGVPDIVSRGKWVTAKIRVGNGGTATAKGITLKALKRRGVTISPSVVKLKSSLKAGKSKTVKVKFKLGKTAADDATVKLRATGKGKLSTEGTVGLVTKAGRPAPVGSPGALKGRYFWANRYDAMYAWDNYAVYFASDDWAYFGFVENGGLPVDCKALVAKTDEDGKPNGEGCFPVTLDKATGAVKIGDHVGTWKDGKLILDEDLKFDELLVPAPGARFQAELEHRGFRGMCGMIIGCSTWHYQLALSDQGTFVKTSSSLTTIGDGWSSPFVAAGRYGPDQYGTYAVLENGLMRLTFANGTVENYPFGVQLKDGKPDPAGEGVLLGEDNYYIDPTPDS